MVIFFHFSCVKLYWLAVKGLVFSEVFRLGCSEGFIMPWLLLIMFFQGTLGTTMDLIPGSVDCCW